MKLKSLLTLTLLLAIACGSNKDSNSNETLTLLLLSRSLQSSSNSNTAQVIYDNGSLLQRPITNCDVDNSSGRGIVVSLPDSSFIKIDPVPTASPFTFAAGGTAINLNLLGTDHSASGAGCILRRTENTATRYGASLDADCEMMGHFINRLDISCTPN
ncbi:MAG: hypothetical protein K8S54_20125 [Spirochaetia bacterium]|nr:hypothetical protein [Spirochaetia bacterium]